MVDDTTRTLALLFPVLFVTLLLEHTGIGHAHFSIDENATGWCARRDRARCTSTTTRAYH